MPAMLDLSSVAQHFGRHGWSDCARHPGPAAQPMDQPFPESAPAFQRRASVAIGSTRGGAMQANMNGAIAASMPSPAVLPT